MSEAVNIDQLKRDLFDAEEALAHAERNLAVDIQAAKDKCESTMKSAGIFNLVFWFIGTPIIAFILTFAFGIHIAFTLAGVFFGLGGVLAFDSKKRKTVLEAGRDAQIKEIEALQREGIERIRARIAELKSALSR